MQEVHIFIWVQKLEFITSFIGEQKFIAYEMLTTSLFHCNLSNV